MEDSEDCGYSQWSHFSTTNGKFENIANALTLLFILTSNSLLLYGLYKTKQTKGFTNKMFIVMSFSDLICGCIIIPLYFVNIYITGDAESWRQLRQVENSVYIFFTFASAVNTMTLSIDRFVFIRYPFKYKQIFNKKRTLALAVYISYSMSSGLIVMERDALKIFYITSILLLAIVFITSITLNVFLVKYIRKQNREMRRLSNTHMQSSYQKRATQTVMINFSFSIDQSTKIGHDWQSLSKKQQTARKIRTKFFYLFPLGKTFGTSQCWTERSHFYIKESTHYQTV